jgi:MFS family permease
VAVARLPYLGNVSRLDRSVRLVMVSWALSSFATIGIDGVLGNLYVLRLGFGSEFLGLVNAVIFITMGVCCLPGSELGRRWGCRKAMILGMGVGTAGLALVPLAVVMPVAWRGAWLIVTYTIAYVGITLRSVNSAPFVMSATTPALRNHAFAALGAATTAGGFAGALLGGMLPGLIGSISGADGGGALTFALSIAIAAALMLPATLVLIPVEEAPRLPDEREPAGSTASGKLPIGLLGLLTFVLLLGYAGNGTVGVFFNVYMDSTLRAPTSLIGTLTALARLVTVPATLLTPLLAARWGNARTYLVSAAAASVVLLPMALVASWPAAAFSYVAMMSLIGLGAPALTVFQQSLVLPQWRPTMSGAVIMAAMIGNGIMSIAAGYVAHQSGFRTLFGLAAGLIATGAVLFGLCFRRHCQRALSSIG